jgi:predicted dehydrogenase
VAQATFSFDTPLERMGVLEITGAEDTLVAPDPNTFGGEIRINRGSEAWESVAATGAEHGRGIGAVDMARTIRSEGAHSTDARLGLHILDAMVATDTSIETGTFVEVESRFDPVAALPEEWDPTMLTLAR